MSFFRNTVWFCKGLSEYTKSGFSSASKRFNKDDLDVSCLGKTYLITGANSGIGKETALEIAKRGGRVHMVCRNAAAAEEAKKEIESVAAEGATVTVHLLDLSQAREVVQFAKQFVEDESNALDCIVNNAGCMINERQETNDGLEKNFATNTVGTHLITAELLPLVSKSEDPRVIIVSSGGMLTQKLDLEDLQSEKMRPFNGTMVYAQNKRQQVVMTRKYAEKYPNVFFASMHPGWADTPAVRSSMPDFYEKMKNKLRSTSEGADTIVWLAVAKAAVKEKSGQFFQDRQPVSEHLPLACSRSKDEDEDRLMAILDEYQEKFSK